MALFEKILVAIDLDSDYQEVLAAATSIAKQNKASLEVMHVMEYSLLPKDYQATLEQECRPRMEALGEEYAVSKKRRHILFGQPYLCITDFASKHNIDLIVVGSHGKQGIRAIIGSTANGVLHHAHCHVLMVRLGAQD